MDKILDFIDEKTYRFIKMCKCGNKSEETQQSNEITNEKTTDKQKRRKIINWLTWKPFYFVYELALGKSKVEIAMEKIKLFCEMHNLGIKTSENEFT